MLLILTNILANFNEINNGTMNENSPSNGFYLLLSLISLLAMKSIIYRVGRTRENHKNTTLMSLNTFTAKVFQVGEIPIYVFKNAH